MTSDPVAVLSAIVAEVAGAGQPFSAESWLPPHLIHDAREAIESAVPASEQDAHELSFVGRIQKAEKTIAEKNREIELLRQACEAIEFVAQDSAQDAHVELLLARIRKADETMAVQWSEIDRLRESVDERDRRIVELQREVESEREACRKSGKRISALHDANAELEKSLESANSENMAICRRCDDLVKKNDDLADEKQVLSASNGRLVGKISKLLETNSDLERRLESAMSNRTQGCLPASLHSAHHMVSDPFDRLTAYGRRQECD